ncbi:MAG: MFS transporter [Gammaproteobacteria bacterium]|nr:MFS transporter [Gammaproteobacteria bacterium]
MSEARAEAGDGANAAAAAVDADRESNRVAKRNVAVLVFAQAVLGSQLAVSIILGGLAGALLAENKSLATLPISLVVLVSMFTAPAASLFMGRFGRRAGFLLGAAAGGIGGALCARALVVGSFGLFLAGAAFTGVYQGTQNFYRFAAADTGTDSFKPQAISWVFAGGLLSALIGPEIVRLTSDTLGAAPYAGAYIVVVVLNVVGALGLMFLDIPRPPRALGTHGSGRPLAVIARQPVFIVAALCAMVGFASMNLVMTSTPLAMVGHGFTSDHAADVVRWHIVAMFAPSFVTGSIIVRFGRLPVIAVGLALLGACGAVALAGVDLHHFYVALIALGIGWNFSFIGATSLLGTVHTKAEQAKVQGLNDFLVFGLVSAGSFSSGALLDAFGWDAVQYAMVPALIAAALGVGWLAVARR